MIAWCDRWIQHYENRLTYERAMLGEQGGIATDRVKPEKGGACKCWASPGPGQGWSYIKRVNQVSVTVEDNWGNGGKNFTRTIPFDQLTAVMTKAEVDEARAVGPERFAESAYGDGFFLACDPVPQRPATQYQPPAWQAIEEAAKTVQAVSAPELFPTPPDLVQRMVDAAEVERCHRTLEPGAGTGNIVKAVRDWCDPPLVAVEINPKLANLLERNGAYVVVADFLECNGDLGQFDRYLMNPPFSAEVAHVRHAYGMLKPGGRLVAIMSEGPFFRQKDHGFRDWLDEVGGESEPLPADSFKSRGTGVDARLVTIAKAPVNRAPDPQTEPQEERFQLCAEPPKFREKRLF